MILRAKNIGLRLVYEQWGYSKSYTVKFPLLFPSQVFFCGIVLDTSYGYEFGPDHLAPKDLSTSGFTKYREEFPNFWWIAIGKQQWGYTGDQSNKITFPLRYSKAVWGIMVTTSVGIPQSPVDVTLSGATAEGYNDTAYKTYWLAYGVQQWGNSNATDRDTTVTFPIAFGVLYSVVAVPKSSSVLGGSNSNFGVKSQNNKSFIANMYDNGHGYAGFNWCAFGKAQALPMDIHQKPAQPLPVS